MSVGAAVGDVGAAVKVAKVVVGVAAAAAATYPEG